MQITYLGTGAAEGIPALFCNCEFCRYARANKIVRSRSGVLLDGELAIDFSPDSFYHEAFLGADLSAIKYLLVTHSHMDHFYAHDFILRGYKYAEKLTAPVLELYGNQDVLDVFSECTRRELLPDVRNAIALKKASPFETVQFGDWQIFTLKARHSSPEPLLYLVERGGKRYLHLTDTGLLPEEDYRFLARSCRGAIDLITFDCTFLWSPPSPNGRHMNLQENMQVLARLNELGLVHDRTKCVITHFSHNGNPTEEALKRAEETYGVIAASDGLTLDF